MTYRHVFGPVPSRRLGVSLGIDVIPFKTCSFNCAYCECGLTTNLTIGRKSFFDYKDILDEIIDFMENNDAPDYITYSGSGEPTLYKDFGILTKKIKEKYPDQKIALLTNSSLFYLKEVREEASLCDLVLPSLDAASNLEFLKLDRPHHSLKLDKIIDGLIEFRKNYSGLIYLEIFFAKGINDTENNINALYKTLKKINPDKIQLNTLDRPPAENFVKPVSKEFLQELVEKWNDLDVEIISRFKSRKEIRSYNNNIEDLIIETIHRRPVTLNDLATITGLPIVEINKYLDVLEKEKVIQSKIINNNVFITILNN